MASKDGGRGRRIVRWVTGVLVVALVAAGVAAWRLDLVAPWYDYLTEDEPPATPTAEGPVEVPPPPGLELPDVPETEPVGAALTTTGGRTSPVKVQQAIAPFLADPDLGPHVLAAVSDLTTGRVLARVGTGPAIPASTTKLLTSLAALEALGPERTFTTRVVSGGKGRIVLVGGGDPFLMSEPVGEDGPSYPVRADITTLARQTAQSLRRQGRGRVRLGYDDSLFAGPGFNPAWPAAYAEDDVVSPITSLWVDEGREPDSFRRVGDPALWATQVFAAALLERGITVVGDPVRGLAGPGGRELASVSSAPLREIVERVVEVSDNEAAEVLAHHVGLEVVGTASFTDGVTGVLRTLRGLGVPTSGIDVHDGSGLSRENRIEPDALVAVLRAAATGDEAARGLVASLPVAGFTGSLTDRFDHAFPDARGLVRAKTGTLTAVSSLAGVAVDQQGHQMLFVLMADRVEKPREEDAEDALDDAAAALGGCFCGKS